MFWHLGKGYNSSEYTIDILKLNKKPSLLLTGKPPKRGPLCMPMVQMVLGSRRAIEKTSCTFTGFAKLLLSLGNKSSFPI